ncbi:DMT family transporter [Solimicrobium silvestre]|uniref:Membrane transporter of cation and cationic drug n=1 Tax=Solimicrobium silvestre TaxID=2099400 RepID=A0A2S9GVJ5_9BURK|nr:multidrug efflux SMR transporter [Solimicrobium silvestre]PRC91749.1 Membrane transporter of cation and cationic drug [Solimicrobium silvestre]
MHYVYLGVAILAEVIATSFLKASDGFQRLIPSLVVIVGYCIAFYFLSLTLKTISVGIAYALWSGIGVVLIVVVSYFLYQQKLDLPGVIGVALIVAGVVVLNVFSTSVSH